jgi:hypothetical protein
MSDVTDQMHTPGRELTAPEREWIRRQGHTARVLADEQRRARTSGAALAPDVMRVRDQFRRDRRRFERTG